jgi:hypothetical protein
MDGVAVFEVRCPSCDVSFPARTRRCLHCGGRTGPSHVGSSKAPSAISESDEERLAAYALPLETGQAPLPGDQGEPRPSRRGRMNAGISLVWILMAVAFSLMRACGEG